MYKTILFDLDGTLTDPRVGIVKGAQIALNAFGIEVENLDDLNWFIGPPLHQNFKENFGFDDEKTKEAVRIFREYYMPIGVYENDLYKGMDLLLQRLKSAGYRLLIATSKPEVLAREVLTHFNIIHNFEFIGGSELDGTRSNKAEVIRYALDNAGVADLSSVVMVGDREYDIIGAKANGIDSIGVLYGYGDIDELKNAGATQIAATIKELEEMLLPKSNQSQPLL